MNRAWINGLSWLLTGCGVILIAATLVSVPNRVDQATGNPGPGAGFSPGRHVEPVPWGPVFRGPGFPRVRMFRL